jgi:hypothetical protein
LMAMGVTRTAEIFMVASSILEDIYKVAPIIVIGCLMTCILQLHLKVVKCESISQVNRYILDSSLGSKYAGYSQICIKV